jgi:hypothetical protein
MEGPQGIGVFLVVLDDGFEDALCAENVFWFNGG